MSGSSRGMIKWAPYKSLVDQSDYLQEMLHNKNKIEHPHISKEKAEHINQVLLSYGGEEIRVSFYEDGYCYYIDNKIEKISSRTKSITIEEKEIDFKDILDVEYL